MKVCVVSQKTVLGIGGIFISVCIARSMKLPNYIAAFPNTQKHEIRLARASPVMVCTLLFTITIHSYVYINCMGVYAHTYIKYVVEYEVDEPRIDQVGAVRFVQLLFIPHSVNRPRIMRFYGTTTILCISLTWTSSILLYSVQLYYSVCYVQCSSIRNRASCTFGSSAFAYN